MPFADRQKQVEYQRLWIKRRRDEYLVGKACVKCGNRDNLELDHIDKGTKAKPIAEIWSMSPSNPVRVAELAKCQVLCGVHHKEKTSEESSVSKTLCRNGHILTSDNIYTKVRNGVTKRECLTCKRNARKRHYTVTGR